MDLGVGSFVFAAGLVAARQPLRHPTSTLATRCRAAARPSLPLLLLGLARLAAVKHLAYAEHVSEYGVHWNFFFTLALLPWAHALLHPLLRLLPSAGLLAMLLGLAYELVLFLPPGMKAYILLSPRQPHNFLSQNREGLFSLAGYLAIFLAGLGLGTGILPPDPVAPPPRDPLDPDPAWLSATLAPDRPPPPPPLSTLLPPTTIHLLKWSLLWSLATLWALGTHGPRLVVSRRMANLAYICWVCAFNSCHLLLLHLVEVLVYGGAPRAASPLLRAWNRNPLALFLLANLLTGAVNLVVPTLECGDAVALAVLGGYLATLCGVAWGLDAAGVRIGF